MISKECEIFRPEPLDIVLILLAAMLLFGANRLPESARAIGKAIREFRDALSGKEESSAKAAHDSPDTKDAKDG